MFAHRPLKIVIRAFAQSSTDVDMGKFVLDKPLFSSHASMDTSVEILKPEVSIQKVTTVEKPQIVSMDTRVFVRTPTGEQIPAIVDKYNSKDASYIVRYEDRTTQVQSWTKLRKMEDDESTRFAAMLPLKEDMPPPSPKARTKTKAPGRKRKGSGGGQSGPRKKNKNQPQDEASEGDEDENDNDASDEEKEGGSHDLQCSEGEEEANDEETESDREFIDDSGLN